MNKLKTYIAFIFLLSVITSCTTTSNTTTGKTSSRKDRVKPAQEVTVNGNPMINVSNNPDKRVIKRVERK